MEAGTSLALQQAENSLEVLKIRELVRKANQYGMSITDYTIRRAIKQGKLPCRRLDRIYLIHWKLFVRWIMCEDGCDNAILVGNSGIKWKKFRFPHIGIK